jgi:hypothetical protein
MANTLTLDNIVPATVPAFGWQVNYKILGDPGPYTSVGPFMAQPIVINTLDPAGTLYEGFIVRKCDDEGGESTQYFWETPCDCANAGVGYEVSPGGDQCQLVEEEAPTISNPGYCLATSQNGAYTNYCSRIYTGAFVDATLAIDPFTIVPLGGGTDPGIFSQLTLTNQWRNDTASSTLGPLNREGVWIDSDCDGDKDPLGVGVQATIAYAFNNLGATRTIYVGVGADNQFRLDVNGATIATFGTGGDYQFKIWHIIPITVVPGVNLINVIGTGDGSVNDAVGMVVYDNTAAEIAAAGSDLALNIPFASHSLRGTTYDIATCDPGYSLDTSGGVGNYVCRRITYAICNGAPL